MGVPFLCKELLKYYWNLSWAAYSLIAFIVTNDGKDDKVLAISYKSVNDLNNSNNILTEWQAKHELK